MHIYIITKLYHNNGKIILTVSEGTVSKYLQHSLTLAETYNLSDYLKQKIEALLCFKSQVQDFPHSRSIEAVEALAKWRGATIGVNAAEAFVLVRKIF